MVDRTRAKMTKVVEKTTLLGAVDEVEYWAKVPMAERIAAVEVIRRRMFGGSDGTRPGLQPVCRVTRNA